VCGFLLSEHRHAIYRKYTFGNQKKKKKHPGPQGKQPTPQNKTKETRGPGSHQPPPPPPVPPVQKVPTAQTPPTNRVPAACNARPQVSQPSPVAPSPVDRKPKTKANVSATKTTPVAQPNVQRSASPKLQAKTLRDSAEDAKMAAEIAKLDAELVAEVNELQCKYRGIPAEQAKWLARHAKALEQPQ